MSSKVSIIIPLYNTEEYIEKAMMSVMNQTYENLEVIVVDDASIDSSGKIADRIAQNDNRVRVLHQRNNSGLSASRNLGMKYATGDYLYFLDSDDYIEQDCIKVCVEEMEKNHLELLTFDANTVSVEEHDGKTFEKMDYDRSNIIEPYDVLSGREFLERYMGTYGILYPTWLMFFKRDFVSGNNLSFLEGSYYEDNKFHFDCMLYAKRICYIPKRFYNRVYRQDSIMTSSISEHKINSVFNIAEGMIDSMLNYANFSDVFWLKYLEYQIMLCIKQVIRAYSTVEKALAIEYYTLYMSRLADLFRYLFKILIKYHITKEDEEYIFCFKMLYEILDRFGCNYDLTIAGRSVEILRDYYRLGIYQVMSDLQLFEQPEKTIGIYGTGKYADYILESYLRSGGRISAKYFFIETNCESYKKTYRGQPVVCISDAYKEKPDAVIIMSTKYDKEMIDSAKEFFTVPIYSVFSMLGSSFISINNQEDTEWVQCICSLITENCKRARIIIMNTPIHSNIGDYMIIQSMEQLINQRYPYYELVKYSYEDVTKRKDEVFSKIRKQDIILLGGGGYLGSLWASGRAVPAIINRCRENKIIIFPQSIFFPENEMKEEWVRKYDEAIAHHKNITICTRDRYSYEIACRLWGEYAKIKLFPDVVLMRNDLRRNVIRQGALLCLRTDYESNMTEEDRNKVFEKTYFSFTNVRATSMHLGKTIFDGEITGAIEHKLDEIRMAEVVVTDTLHCMISCLLTGTPCIAIDNCYKKIRGIYEWIKEVPYIYFFENVYQFLEFDITKWEVINKKWKYEKRFEKEAEELLELIER